MCFVGYIIGDNHPCLKTISEKEIDLYSGVMPILIVGFEKAVGLFPHINIIDKIIDNEKRIYYSFSKEESEIKYQENLDNFIKNCLKGLEASIKIINVVTLEDIKITPQEIFLYENFTTITITTFTKVFHVNKEITSFFNKESITKESIINLLSECKIISWDCCEFYGAFLKVNNCYKSKEQVRILFSSYCNIDLYMGTVCLNLLKTLKKDTDLVSLWQRAYKVESNLSEIKIKVDIDKISKLAEDEDNIIMQNINQVIDEGYILQKYNGTNKVTGRIYPYGSGFSLQSLPKLFRNIIIAEPGCVLVEFDYKAFEYVILSQICNNITVSGDPHLTMSLLLFGDEEHRDIGKNINYSLLYGKSINQILEKVFEYPDLKISKKDLELKLTEIISPLETLQKKLEKELKENGCFKNCFGRDIYPEKSWACINNFFQSTAAEIFIIKLNKLFELLSHYDPINKIVLQSHDSVLLNLNLDTIEKTNIAEEIKILLESPEKGLINLVHIKYGGNWGELT